MSQLQSVQRTNRVPSAKDIEDEPCPICKVYRGRTMSQLQSVKRTNHVPATECIVDESVKKMLHVTTLW